MMKQYFPAALSLLALLAAACGHRQAAPQNEPPAIEVARVTVDSVVLHKTYPGYIRANNTVDVVGRVNGTLTAQLYSGGDYVKAGQTLFTIESTQYADRVKQAEASLATARSSLAYATAHYEAVKKALECDAVSQMEVEQARSDMEQGVAAVSNAEAALRTARTNLGYCTVKSPVDGRVTSSTVSVGAYVNGEGAPFTLATVYDDSMMKAVFDIEDARHLRLLRDSAPGAGAGSVTVGLAFEEPLSRDYTGTVSYVAPEIDTSTGTIRLKATVGNPDRELRDGMYVTVSLPYGRDPRAILVKEASVGTDQLGRYLYTVNDSNRVVYTPVTVGETVNDSMCIVTSGLTPRSRYVTKALLKVRSGEAIRPVEVK